ncbi:hypothetical protein [Butyrivibrio sp. NC3005]|uniref:hypothetical protein n=1 Tax=Butyrivibrio sp. NC3005 TaxID=1280685 RepID=UPI0004288AAB|nr:hypothetical protein [Butyrivibrio sp. NC3005]
MRRGNKKLFYSVGLAAALSVSVMFTPLGMENVSAKEQVVLHKEESVSLETGQTALLECERAYGYSDYDISWSFDKEGIVSIVSSDDGNTYDSYTNAVIKAEHAGKTTVTMHADYHGMWSYDEKFEVEVTGDSSDDNGNSEEEKEDTKNLYIRLVGSFNHKMVGEQDVDTVSSATHVSYKSDDVNAVKLEAALVDKDTARDDISEDAWHSLSYFEKSEDAVKINPDHTKTKIDICPQCPGVEASYNVWDGTVILKGTPQKEGNYKVSVTFTDTENRTAVSNEVDFHVYAQSEKLIDNLKYENCTKTPDGKYIYDQTSWYMPDLGESTVKVPKDIKAWFGSHEMGTYGELGKAISLTNGEQPTQTLIIPKGANLTMVNMRVHSSVKIIVEKGAKFSIRQSTLEGIVDVKKGASISVDYIDYGEDKGFIYGSAVNGQIRLHDGATIENARIISHTNFSQRDDFNRKNSEPVVKVDGKVNVKGDVYILADEAADYGVGQKALYVKGSLNVPEGSTLAVYGGGRSQLSSKGGDAITLNKGKIAGNGRLVAIGGFGMNLTGNRSIIGGGCAVSGNGSISISKAYLEGGYSFDKETDPVGGKVKFPAKANCKFVTGKCIAGTGETTSPYYWSGTGDSNGTCPKIDAIPFN